MPVKPQDPNNRPSASAVDADSTAQADSAAQAEANRIEEWSKPSFAERGRHQLQLDQSYYRKEK